MNGTDPADLEVAEASRLIRRRQLAARELVGACLARIEAANPRLNAFVHVDADAPCTIGRAVTIGHGATVHGCTVGDFSLIGIGATILSHAVIGKYCLVGAGALITERKQFADRSLIIGAPARRLRELTDEECRGLEASAANYAERGRQYRRELAERSR